MHGIQKSVRTERVTPALLRALADHELVSHFNALALADIDDDTYAELSREIMPDLQAAWRRLEH